MAQAFRIPPRARQAHESGVDIMGAGVGDDAGDLALRSTRPWCRTTEVIAVLDLVEQVSGPQHADACSATSCRTWLMISARALTSSPTVASSSNSRRGRCSNARAISSRRIWPPERSRTCCRRDRPSQCARAPRAAQACFAPVNAVQGGVIEQVLRHREIEVERARLEHDAQQPQRFAQGARPMS